MAAGNFAACLAFTLEFEGGKVDDPHDPGGRTNQGVTQHTYNHWRALHGAARRDVYKMTKAERDAIYRHGYWDKCGCEELPAGLDLCVFDYAVNSGPERALHVLRECKNIHAYCVERLDFLKRLTTWPRYKNGWTRRVQDCAKRALEMVETEK